MSFPTNTAGESSFHQVSEQVYESLLIELVNYVSKEEREFQSNTHTQSQKKTNNAGKSDADEPNIIDDDEDDESKILLAEKASGRLERMGYLTGYRLTERLAQSKTWNAVPNQDAAAAVASQQLEAVKFLCKECWMEIFGKQIDKLQTNHRGVFVLKDSQLRWLTRFPIGQETSRVMAIRLLAFPCGIIRGCLANLGIPAVVSCDFLSDGQNMSACSFNIKVR